jgi:2-polyprenyl-6-methoxyphenol hydroxylase-like FAD-dependent oxidoreductase
MADADPRIVIIGAGIGGLSAALHLHANGFSRVTVYEAAPRLDPLGVGINVQPHASLVLRDLGLLPALLATGIATRELNFYNRHGDAILSEPRGAAAGYAVPQLSIHRGHLQTLLLAAARERLGADRVHMGHALVDFVRDERAGVVRARFAASPGAEGPVALTADADLLIAADGINSTVRQLLYPDEGPPHFSGRMLWRGCIEREPFLSGASMVWGGHADQKFVAYPISETARKRGRSLVNWICEIRVRDANDPDTTPPKTDYLATVPKDRFAPQFEKWEMGGLKVKDLIAETDKVYEFPMCDRGKRLFLLIPQISDQLQILFRNGPLDD